MRTNITQARYCSLIKTHGIVLLEPKCKWEIACWSALQLKTKRNPCLQKVSVLIRFLIYFLWLGLFIYLFKEHSKCGQEQRLLRGYQHSMVSSQGSPVSPTFGSSLKKNVDKGDTADIISLDFQKVFDKVLCPKLLSKCSRHGITGQVLLWIKNWLNINKQQQE